MGVVCATAEKYAVVKNIFKSTAVKLKAVPTESGCLIGPSLEDPHVTDLPKKKKKVRGSVVSNATLAGTTSVTKR